MMKLDCCPSCKKQVEKDAETRPFCCARCRDADLLGWFNEEYKVSRELHGDEVDAFLATQVTTLNPYDLDNF